MEYKQQEIIKVLRERIASGRYTDLLPRAVDLAAEFQVNVKTVNKAVGQLAEEGILERKRHSGTRIVRDKTAVSDTVIEVLFDGFTSIFTHPFWHAIWDAMIRKLSLEGYKTILTMLDSAPETGLLKLDELSFFPAAGRVILGAGEKVLLDRAAEMRVPFLTACDPLDPAIPQISFDFTEGIRNAVIYLHDRGCRRVGFIGQTQSFIHPNQLNKFNAYLGAEQNFGQIDAALIGSTRPTMGGGAKALDEMLKHARPDALIAAYDHQLPEILQVLKERSLVIPVIGCDGLELPGFPADRLQVKAPLRECGRLVAEKLVQAIHTRKRPGSVILKARFENGK